MDMYMHYTYKEEGYYDTWLEVFWNARKTPVHMQKIVSAKLLKLHMVKKVWKLGRKLQLIKQTVQLGWKSRRKLRSGSCVLKRTLV